MATGDVRDGRGGPKGSEEGTADDLVRGVRVARILLTVSKPRFCSVLYNKITPFRLTTTGTMYHKLILNVIYPLPIALTDVI